MTNKLNIAKKAKDDEFYTLPEDVSSEMSHYDFTGKRVFCPFDARHSAFTQYFEQNYTKLGLRSLTIAWRDPKDGTGGIDEYDGVNWKEICRQQEGGFETPEATAELHKSDIVVTNPPFSRTTNFWHWLQTKQDVKFIFINTVLLFERKYVFHRAEDGLLYPLAFPGHNKISSFIHNGSPVHLSNALWFQNLHENHWHLKAVPTPKDPSSFLHPCHRDFNDALYVRRLKDIPENYYGRLAVPVSFPIYDVSRDFGILEVINDSFGGTLLSDGKTKPFLRLIVRRKRNSNEPAN